MMQTLIHSDDTIDDVPATGKRVCVTPASLVWVLLPCVLLGLDGAGCTTSPQDGALGAGPITIQIGLRDVGEFAEVSTASSARSAIFDFASRIGDAAVTAATLSLNANDIRVTAIDESPTPFNGAIALLVYYGSDGVDDSCADLAEFTRFDITFADGAVTSVAPVTAVVPMLATAEVVTGRFGICLDVTSDVPAQLTIGQLTLMLQ